MLQRGYKGFQGVTEVTGDYKKFQGVQEDKGRYKGLKRITGG